MSIYNNVRVIIAAKNYPSIAQLERATGLSNGSIGKWDKSTPNLANVMKVANELDVSVDALLSDSLVNI